jgi:hypothetical protein
MPLADDRASQHFWMRSRVVQEPAQQSVPHSDVPRRMQRPAELVEGPVHLGGIPRHRCRYPIRLVVKAAPCHRYEVIDGSADFPEGRMSDISLPVRMKGKIGWQSERDDSQDRRKHQSVAAVTVDESVTNEDTRSLDRAVDAFADRLGRECGRYWGQVYNI